MKKIINLGVFTLAILITTAVSLGCNFWFFYSLFGGQGNEAIAAGLSGCAIQLFGYGFSMYISRAKWYLKPVIAMIAILPLMLSMFTTFTTVYGFVASESIKQQNLNKRDEYIYSALEQSKASQKLLQETAEQGLTVRARSQVERLMKSGNEAKALDAELIKQISTNQAEEKKTSPLDGLILLAGDKEKTLKMFCVLLAALFDILPVMALMMIGNEEKKPTPRKIETTKETISDRDYSDITITDVSAIKADAEVDLFEEIQTYSTVAELPENVLPFVAKPQPVSTSVQENDCDELDGSKVEVDYNSIILALKRGDISPSYKDVQSFAGLSQWEAQKFFKWAQAEGMITRPRPNKFQLTV